MVSSKIYLGIWAALVVATFLEVFARSLTGPASILVATILVISFGKAILIALYFQHLRYESRVLAVLPLAGIVALGILAITIFSSLGMQ